MSFIWPAMLLFLLLAPVLVVFYLRHHQRRRRMEQQYGRLGVVPAALARPLGRRRHIPPALFLAGIIVLLVSLARPQTTVTLPRQAGTVILAFDASGSMAADDIQPSRMDAAKAAAQSFVEHQPDGILIGVVAFSDSGFAIQAPTADQAAILSAISRLAPQRGTSLAQGIFASLSTLAAASGEGQFLYSDLTPAPVAPGTNKSAAIILLTDGENNEPPDPLQAAQAAADRGVRIFTIGLGSPGGTTLHLNGFTVHTQLNELGLQQVAQLTEGAYYNASSQQELGSIYDNLDLQFVLKTEHTEVTALFAGAGLLVLLLGAALSLLWFNRLP